MLTVKVGQQTSADGQPEIAQTSREPGRQSVQNQAVNSALVSAGKQIITQGVSQFADLTGNYAKAETFNDVMTIAGDIGILATGPVGWIAVGTKTTMQISSSVIQQKRAVDNIDLQRQRLGFISTDGSRYSR